MKAKELIKILEKNKELEVVLINLDDEDGDSNIILKEGAIDKIERYDESKEKYTGEYFIGICHRNAEHLRDLE